MIILMYLKKKFNERRPLSDFFWFRKVGKQLCKKLNSPAKNKQNRAKVDRLRAERTLDHWCREVVFLLVPCQLWIESVTAIE